MSNESTNIIETMSAELEHLRPMEASLEMAEADVKAYKQRIAVLEKEVGRLQRYHDAEATKWLAENQKLKDDVDKVIAEKDKEIAELKQKLESVQASMYCDVVDANMENRRLKEERRWRKFPEEKPKWGEEVLVVDDENKKYIVRFSHDMKWISWGKMNTCESENVKYWMPLPSAPKETVK